MSVNLLLALLLSAPAATTAALQTAPEGARDPQAAWHPASATYYLRIPDLQALPAAYRESPLMLLALDPELAEVVDRLSGGQVQVSDLLEQAAAQLSLDNLPPELLAMGLDRALTSAKGLSVSLSWPNDLKQAFGESHALMVSIGRMNRLKGAIFEREFGSFDFEEFGLAQDSEEAGDAEQEPLTDLSDLPVAPELLVDGWGRPFLYQPLPTLDNGADVEQRYVISLGADGAEGGEGINSDLVGDFNSDAVAQQVAGSALLKALGLQVNFSFADAQVASDLVTALAAKLPPGVKSEQVGPAEAPWSSYLMSQSSPLGELEGWLAHSGTEVALGFANNSLQSFAGRCAGSGGLLADKLFAQARAGTELPAGQVVVESYQSQSLLRLTQQVMDLLVDINGEPEISGVPIPLSTSQLLSSIDAFIRVASDGFGPRFARSVLSGGVFQKRRFQPGASGPRLIGASALDTSLLEQIDPEAGMVWAGGADVRGLFDLLCQHMGFTPEGLGEFPRAALQEQGGFSFETDLLGQLEPQFVFTAGIVKGLAAPAMVGYLKAKDAAKLQRGLEAWLRGLVSHDPAVFALKDRPYKKLPFYELKVSAGTPGADGAAPESMEYIFGLRGNMLFISINRKAVKDELKREVGPEAARSALVGHERLQAGANEVVFIDYPAYIGGLYGLVKGFGALAAGAAGQDLPFDVSQLPDADLLLRHFQATLSVTQIGPQGATTTATSSFGPEIPLAVFGAFAVTLTSFGEPEYVVATEADLSQVGYLASEPLPAAPADALELTRAKLLRLRTALEVYHWDRSAYPNQLSDLTTPSANYPQGYLEGESIPLDDWGHAFVYALTSEGGFLLRSMGPNGQDDRGEGDDVRAN
jgi:hypothetical protein